MFVSDVASWFGDKGKQLVSFNFRLRWYHGCKY
jgi:hypothetical protein